MTGSRAAAALVGVGLIAAVAAVSGADAPAAPDNSPHLVIVPSTAQGEAALAASSARVVARYDSFTLAEASGSDYARLRRAGADRRDDLRQVALARGPMDPAARSPLVAKGRTPRRSRAGLALVQFVGPVKQAWVDRLERTGVRVAAYLPQDAYLVHGSGAELTRAGALPGKDPAVRAVTSVQPADKLAPELPRSGKVDVELQTLSGEDGAAARARAASAGRELRRRSAVGGVRTQFLRLDARELERLAADPGVVAVVPYARRRLLDERAAQVVAGNVSSGLPTGPGYLGWLTAAPHSFSGSRFDFAIDVTDSGLDTGSVPTSGDGSHPDFYEGGDPTSATRVAYEENYTSDPDARDCGGHGTNVASIAAGYNDRTIAFDGDSYGDAAGYRYGLGVAPFAQIGASKAFDCSLKFDIGSHTLTDIATAAYAAGARISNNSWGAGPGSGYDADAQEMDQIVRDLGMVEVFAAGNDGDRDAASTVGAPGTAKNVITVGASENVRPAGTDGCMVTDAEADNARDIAGFSSRGPTDDNRIKPDVVAPGTHVTGASPQNASFLADGSGTCNPQFPSGNTLYSLISGTSQATPEVAGAAALVRDWYTRTHGSAPSPAMTKAILVNSATDLAGGSDGAGGRTTNVPNPDQGWGRVNLGAAFDATARSYRDQVAADVISSTGETRQQVYTVQDSSRPLKVTLVWTDPAPATLSGNPWVNDLDLEVDAGGRTYKGNVFGNGFSVTGGSADPRDNVESVYLPAGVSGTVAVRVRGTNIVGDGAPGNGDGSDQDYALVVSNAAPDTKPVLVHGSTWAIDDASGGDGDGVVEPGESFSFTEQVSNSGNADATGLTGTLETSNTAVALDRATSAYPYIPAGGSASGSTPFRATLAGSATCGRDVAMTLDLAGDSGVAGSVPVTIPTGSVGAPVSYTLPSANQPIPDDAVTGATSALLVRDAGVVKDVEVEIESLAHTWVGDLRITLTSPSGTTVVLADRPGGPRNSGDNLTGTVFSDGASQPLGSVSAPYTGSFRPPSDQLSRFDGEGEQGYWILRVSDLEPGDTGTLFAWGLRIRSATCSAGGTPAPGGTGTGSGDTGTGGSGGTGTGPVDGTSGRDASPPRIGLKVLRARLARALATGVRLRVSCSERCRLSARLQVPGRAARRLHLSRGSAVTVGRARVTLPARAERTLAVRLSRRARHALERRRGIDLRLLVTATDAAGSTRRRSASVRLRR